MYLLKNAYLLAKIGADTAENEQHFAEILPIGRRVADGRLARPGVAVCARIAHDRAAPRTLVQPLEPSVAHAFIRNMRLRRRRGGWFGHRPTCSAKEMHSSDKKRVQQVKLSFTKCVFPEKHWMLLIEMCFCISKSTEEDGTAPTIRCGVKQEQSAWILQRTS